MKTKFFSFVLVTLAGTIQLAGHPSASRQPQSTDRSPQQRPSAQQATVALRAEANRHGNWTQETSAQTEVLIQVLTRNIHDNFLRYALRFLNKPVTTQDDITFDNFMEIKKNLLSFLLDPERQETLNGFENFKNQFAIWLQNYFFLDSWPPNSNQPQALKDEYAQLLKLDKVDILVDILNSGIWKNYNKLAGRLSLTIRSYLSSLKQNLATCDQNDIDIFTNVTTDLATPVDLEDDTYLITAILDSGFWQEDNKRLAEDLCSLCLAITNYENYGDLLSPLLKSQIFRGNKELAIKTAELAIEKFDWFIKNNVLYLCQAQAKVATRVIKSGIWEHSEELIEKLETMCSQAIQGMEDNPIEDDEDNEILEMVGDPIESNDKERIEALLKSITESGIWQYWIWS